MGSPPNVWILFDTVDCIPVGLGSYWALPVFAVIFPVLFHFRMVNEEKLLARELDGYTDYCQKVRARIIPFIW